MNGGLPLYQVHALGYRAIRKDNLADARQKPGQPMMPGMPGHDAPAGHVTPAASANAPTTAPAGPTS